MMVKIVLIVVREMFMVILLLYRWLNRFVVILLGEVVKINRLIVNVVLRLKV